MKLKETSQKVPNSKIPPVTTKIWYGFQIFKHFQKTHLCLKIERHGSWKIRKCDFDLKNTFFTQVSCPSSSRQQQSTKEKTCCSLGSQKTMKNTKKFLTKIHLKISGELSALEGARTVWEGVFCTKSGYLVSLAHCAGL